MKLIHWYEPTMVRRARLNSKTVHGQALCSNGSAHQFYGDKSNVNCPACLKMKPVKKAILC